MNNKEIKEQIKCPNCGDETDNGFSRDVPPIPYYCSKCEDKE